jgi:hypothetical protein
MSSNEYLQRLVELRGALVREVAGWCACGREGSLRL